MSFLLGSLLIPVLHRLVQRLPKTNGEGTNSLGGTRCEHSTASTGGNRWDSWNRSCSDENGADDAHGLGVLGRNEVERVDRIQEPNWRIGYCGHYGFGRIRRRENASVSSLGHKQRLKKGEHTFTTGSSSGDNFVTLLLVVFVVFVVLARAFWGMRLVVGPRVV